MANVLQRIAQSFRMPLAASLLESTRLDMPSDSTGPIVKAVPEAFRDVNVEVLVAGIFVPPHLTPATRACLPNAAVTIEPDWRNFANSQNNGFS